MPKTTSRDVAAPAHVTDAIAAQYGVRPELLRGRSVEAAWLLAREIATNLGERISVVPETAVRPSTLPTREQRKAAEAEAAENAAIEEHPDVVAAREAAENAAVALADLEAAVVAGADHITEDDTAHARERSRFAALKLAAARSRVRQQREADRETERQTAVQAALQALGETHSPAALEALRDKAAAALAALLHAINAQHDAIHNTRATFKRLGAPEWGSRDASMEDISTGAVPWAFSSLANGGWVWIGGQRYAEADRERLVKQAIAQADQQTGRRLHLARGLRSVLR